MQQKIKKADAPAEKIFFTSDMHFGHEGIITFAGRPFADAAEMDAAIIEKWNAAVPADGLVFVLGDIGFTRKKRIEEIFASLNGSKILIRGNHDCNYPDSVLNSLFDEIYEALYIRIRDAKSSKYRYIYLSHYPMLDWPSSFMGSWQLFGHLHTRGLVEFDYLKTKLFAAQYDVGVDNNNFSPVSFYDIKKIIAAQGRAGTFKKSNYSL